MFTMKLPPGADTESPSATDNTSSTEQDVDFTDYMWMGEEMEEFDSKVCNFFCFIFHNLN